MTIKKNIHIWDFTIIDHHQAKFSISIRDFFNLKPILKSTYTRVHLKDRIGLPFFLDKLFKRKGFLLGLILFISIIYIFSSMIWTISVEGNHMIKTEKIYQAIDQIGIHKGMFKRQLPEQSIIQDKLQTKLPDTAWIGVHIEGTKLNITIVEKVKPVPKSNLGARNIIADKDAVVERIIAEKGIPKVKVNDRVKKGDILISGLIGNEENKQAIAAKGIVKGIVWYQSVVTVPMVREWKEYTGNFIEKKYIGIGNRMIKYKGYSDINYKKFEKKYYGKRVSWKNYQLPVIFVTEKILEYEEKREKITTQDAYNIAIFQAENDLNTKISSNSKLLSRKILQQQVVDDKLSIKIIYEVLEDITKTQPIIQGE